MTEQPLKSLLRLQGTQALSGAEKNRELAELYVYLRRDLSAYLRGRFPGSEIEGYLDDVINFVAMRCVEPDRFHGASVAEARGWLHAVANNKASDLLQLKRKQRGIQHIPIAGGDEEDSGYRQPAARNIIDRDINGSDARFELYSSIATAVDRALTQISDKVHAAGTVSPRERATLYLRMISGKDTVADQMARLFPDVATARSTAGSRERALIYKLHERGRDDLCQALRKVLQGDPGGEDIRTQLEQILCIGKRREGRNE